MIKKGKPDAIQSFLFQTNFCGALRRALWRVSVNPLRSVRTKGGTERVRVPLRSPRGRLPRFAIVGMGLLC